MFLDTARLGLMSPGAQRAQMDLARLAGEEGASPRFERFLLGGFEDPADVARYPGLACWRGVGYLKRCLQALPGGLPDLPVLLASRSAALMRLAARLLLLRCRNVLTADLGWPGYHAILAAEATRVGGRVTVVPLLDGVLSGRVGEAEVGGRLQAAYLTAGCDGVFLPAVSSHGVRVPVERVSRALESVREPRLVVIDGAQEFCHAPTNLGGEYCDLYIAGSHKWLGGHNPLGIGFYGRRRSRSLVEQVLTHLIDGGELDDPLLRFTARLESGLIGGVDETVELAPLFTCQGAVEDAACTGGVDRLFSARLANVTSVENAAPVLGWTPCQVGGGLRTGILLLDPERPQPKARSAAATRSLFAGLGVILTAYDGGRIRLSLPGSAWTVSGLGVLTNALAPAA